MEKARDNAPRRCMLPPGHGEAVQALIKGGCDANNAENDDGATPLHAAAQEGHGAAVQALINAGCDLERPTVMAPHHCMLLLGLDTARWLGLCSRPGATPRLRHRSVPK